MQAARSSFASFDAHERNRKGINGALTPARAHRSSHQQKNTNDYHHHPASTSTPNSAYPSDRTPSRLRHRQERLVGGEGISLQETEARIDELERGEFDLKLKLFYMEEQLASATGGDDGLQLHKEVIDAKLQRAQAEQKARAAGVALSELEVKCRELETQVRDCEEQRTRDRENWATLEGENEARLKKHTHLLEDALRAERSENARLRLALDSRRGSWDGSGQQPQVAAPRRRSAGEDGRGQPPDPWRGSGGSGGGFGREQRDQHQQLSAKLRSQDSSLRSLRADVTTLRRRLRTQAETLAQQKEENATVRRAAEQVACVEAEEIARLAVDLERAVRSAKAEADKRRTVEDRLATAEARLSCRETGALEPRSSHRRSRSPIGSPPGTGTGGRTRGRGERGREGNGGEGRGKSADFHPGEVLEAPPGENGGKECSSLPPPRGALSSTIASRGRSVHDRPATGSNGFPGGLKGKGRASLSPRRSRNAAEAKGQRRPWGSSPPSSPRRKGDGGPNTSLTATRDRQPADGGASSAERKQQHRRRHSEERLPAERASAGRGGDPGCHGDKYGYPSARQTATEPPGRESRYASADWREAGSLPSSTEQKGDAKNDPAAEADRDRTAGARRERPPSSRAQGTPGVGTAAAAAASALRGVDLSAKIAQELRAAVATTPASAVSPGYFSDGSSGQTTPAGGGGRVGDDVRRADILGCLEGGDLLKSIWQGTSQYALDGDHDHDTKRKPIAAMRSREVAELESDVQHIFQFFAAKDGRKRSGMRAADGGENGHPRVT